MSYRFRQKIKTSIMVDIRAEVETKIGNSLYYLVCREVADGIILSKHTGVYNGVIEPDFLLKGKSRRNPTRRGIKHAGRRAEDVGHGIQTAERYVGE